MIRIFLVDDDPRSRASVKAAVELRTGWTIVGEAYDGIHALATFHLHETHITLMDFAMPEMNGLDAARHLKERYPDILILMITANAFKGLAQEAKSAGIRGLCYKGNVRCIHSAIEAVMNGKTYFSDDYAA